MSQKQQMTGRYYAQLRRKQKHEKEFSRLVFELYKGLDTHTHSDPTGVQAINNMKWRYE